MHAALESYHDAPASKHAVVFDKSRGWLGQLELAEAALGRKAKVLLCVRDLRDVLASFEKLWRRNAAFWGQDHEQHHYAEWQTVAGRCEIMMRPNMVVGGAYRIIRRALATGFRDRLFFVEFEQFTANPALVMRAVYDFLGEPHFAHDFENVEQVTTEDDFTHGIPGLHNIRSKITPVEPQWPVYLGDAAARYEAFNRLWQMLDGGPQAPALPDDELKPDESAGATTAAIHASLPPEHE
jgi:sulfotransferase